ncbi:uncharacterized protein LOC109600295 isoform X2 [Aethina tumida]|uniref:uncharacterized protein LOC109600295 isoform X2 n=1 Tax=Aethina tumida TaxID=116153 RepID=UPI00096AE08E|nr:uncharacterized protein LOC109600295 isoform X2 [Aethina tumida]
MDNNPNQGHGNQKKAPPASGQNGVRNHRNGELREIPIWPSLEMARVMLPVVGIEVHLPPQTSRGSAPRANANTTPRSRPRTATPFLRPQETCEECLYRDLLNTGCQPQQVPRPQAAQPQDHPRPGFVPPRTSPQTNFSGSYSTYGMGDPGFSMFFLPQAPRFGDNGPPYISMANLPFVSQPLFGEAVGYGSNLPTMRNLGDDRWGQYAYFDITPPDSQTQNTPNAQFLNRVPFPFPMPFPRFMPEFPMGREARPRAAAGAAAAAAAAAGPIYGFPQNLTVHELNHRTQNRQNPAPVQNQQQQMPPVDEYFFEVDLSEEGMLIFRDEEEEEDTEDAHVTPRRA